MFRKMKISARLAAGFALVLIALFVVCALSVNSIKDAIATSHVTAERNAKTSALSNAQSAVWSLRWDVAQFIAVTDAADRKLIIDRASDTRKQFENAMSIYLSVRREQPLATGSGRNSRCAPRLLHMLMLH